MANVAGGSGFGLEEIGIPGRDYLRCGTAPNRTFLPFV